MMTMLVVKNMMLMNLMMMMLMMLMMLMMMIPETVDGPGRVSRPGHLLDGGVVGLGEGVFERPLHRSPSLRSACPQSKSCTPFSLPHSLQHAAHPG